MPTYRVNKNKDNPYVMMNKEFLSDDRLSYKGKGILSYLLSKPDNWKVYENDLVNQSKGGITSVRSGLKELEELDYIHRTQMRTKEGKFDGYNYDVFEVPITKEDYNNKDSTVLENPKTDKPISDNQKVVSNELSNNDLTNKEKHNGATSTEDDPTFSFNEFKNIFTNPDDLYLEEVYPAIKYYIFSYEYEFNELHPKLKYNQWETVVNNLCTIEDKSLNRTKTDISYSLYQKMIDKHFDTNYSIPIDYKIHHFKGDILKNRCYEVGGMF